MPQRHLGYDLAPFTCVSPAKLMPMQSFEPPGRQVVSRLRHPVGMPAAPPLLGLHFEASPTGAWTGERQCGVAWRQLGRGGVDKGGRGINLHWASRGCYASMKNLRRLFLLVTDVLGRQPGDHCGGHAHELYTPHLCNGDHDCNGHPAMPVAPFQRCYLRSKSCCFVQAACIAEEIHCRMLAAHGTRPHECTWLLFSRSSLARTRQSFSSMIGKQRSSKTHLPDKSDPCSGQHVNRQHLFSWRRRPCFPHVYRD